jgi:hypothetical protein
MSDELIIYNNSSRPSDGVKAVISLSRNKKTQTNKISDGSLFGRKVVPMSSSLLSDFFQKKVNNA